MVALAAVGALVGQHNAVDEEAVDVAVLGCGQAGVRGRGAPPRIQRTAPAAPTRPVSTSRHTSWPSSARTSCSRRRNSSSVSGQEERANHGAWWAEPRLPLLRDWSPSRARAGKTGLGTGLVSSPSGPNLERAAGHLWMCPQLGQSQSLHPRAGSFARSVCGLTHSGSSLAGALE